MLADGVWDHANPDAKLRDYVYAELGRDHIQSGAEYLIMRRDIRWKYVVYPGSKDGELYDLANDPDEVHNLWHDPKMLEQKKTPQSKSFHGQISAIFVATDLHPRNLRIR